MSIAKLAAVIGMLIAAQSPTLAAAADGRIQLASCLFLTDAEKALCRSDVVKRCTADIPNPLAILFCLKANRTLLRPACRALLEGCGQ